MKKLLMIFTVMMLFCLSVRAQALVGYSMGEVRKEHPDENWEYGKWGDDKTLNTMAFKKGSVSVIYLFNENNVSIGTAIVPTTQGMLQGMIETYNKRYVVVDDMNWKFYVSGDVLKCSLMKTDEETFYFYWYK